MNSGTLLLRRSEVARLLPLNRCIAAVEDAFRKLGRGEIPGPGILGMHVNDGGFHIKAALLGNDNRQYFAVKCNANFSENMRRFGLPAIQGVVLLCDAESGYPLAIMDSIEITVLRTGAATAVAAKYLARPDSAVATICGCGTQGWIQLRSIMEVLRITEIFAFDIDNSAATRFAERVLAELGIRATPVADLNEAVPKSDVCVTCTPSRRPFLLRRHVRPGTFVAAVGADNADKQELDPTILKDAVVVADVLEQCVNIGELHHAVKARLLGRDGVHAELGEVVAGIKTGRTAPDEITVFDSTGAAIHDIAAAVAVFEGRGTGQELEWINLNS